MMSVGPPPALPRALPIRVPPQPGEALDSWFDALAHRLEVAVADLLPAIGLARGARRHADRALDVPADWNILLRLTEADALAHATGVPADTIRAMTLAHYDQRAVVIDHAARRVNIRTLWGRVSVPGTVRSAWPSRVGGGG
jgi:hypothetical protein